MNKLLVVMRHGKATPFEFGQRDTDRVLTEAGVAALDARLPHMLKLLETRDEAAEIWASSAVRAHQSAELLEKALRAKGVCLERGIELHDSLLRQDVDAFLDELHKSEASVVFAVGHIPFVEDVVEELAGATPFFSTGSVGCLELSYDDTGAQEAWSDDDKAKLLWFVHGPTASRWDTLLKLQATITRTAETIEERREAFFANPEDVETIHRFRTNSRTLRSLVAFIKPWQNAQQNAEIQVIMRDIVRYTSLLRELDVLEKHVRASDELSPKLLAFCENEAATERAKVLEVLASKQVTRSFERAMALAKDITWKKRVAKRGLSADEARARFDALVASVSADIDALDLSDAEKTHDVRKRAKRARYVSEFCGDVVGEDALDIAKGMMAHQDKLGDVCDARADIRLISEFLRRDLPKSVARDLAAMRAQSEAVLEDALKAAK